MSDLEAEKAALQDAMFGGDMSGFSDDTQNVEENQVANSFEDDGQEQEQEVESDFEMFNEEEPENQEQEEAFDAKQAYEDLKKQVENDKQPVAQYSQEEQNLIATGRQIHQLQSQNPELYNEMINFAQQRMNGNTPPKKQENAIKKQINAFRETIESDAYKDMDTKPFKQMADLMEMQLQQNEVLQNNNQVARQQLNTKLTELDTYRKNTEERKAEKIANTQLKELASAEKEFGMKIKNGSRAAKRLVALVDSGESVRDAFVLVTGSTEKAKPARKRAITTSNGKSDNAKTESPDRQALRKHIFGENTKKRGVITYR